MAKYFSAVDRDTLGTTIYYEIRSAILNGDFDPGDSIKIRDIAKQMGVSATPVRDALLQLVMERVLVMPSSREIRVPVISSNEFHEIRVLRVMLEGYAAEEAAKVITELDIKKLEEINSKIEKAFNRKNPKQALFHNRAFHSCLYGIAGMVVLEDVIDRLWLRLAPIIASWSSSASANDFTAHHYDVIEALKAGNGTAAKAAITGDIIEGGRKIEEAVTEFWPSS